MSIYCTGDTHGKDIIPWSYGIDGYKNRLSMTAFPEQADMSKEDYIIICGDFGGVWDTNRYAFEESEDEKEGLDWLENKSFTTLFVPGNHENYHRLTGCHRIELLHGWFYENMPKEEKGKLQSGYPRKAWHGGFVREIRPSVLMLEAGVFNIDGKTCFAYGGAQSHDIDGGILKPWEFDEDEFNVIAKDGLGFSRIYGVSWWPEEQPSAETEHNAIEALKRVDCNVDFVFTHCPAASDQRQLGFAGNTRIDKFLETVKQNAGFKHWFCGHLHINTDLPGGKTHVVYEQILRIN